MVEIEVVGTIMVVVLTSVDETGGAVEVAGETTVVDRLVLPGHNGQATVSTVVERTVSVEAGGSIEDEVTVSVVIGHFEVVVYVKTCVTVIGVINVVESLVIVERDTEEELVVTTVVIVEYLVCSCLWFVDEGSGAVVLLSSSDDIKELVSRVAIVLLSLNDVSNDVSKLVT